MTWLLILAALASAQDADPPEEGAESEDAPTEEAPEEAPPAPPEEEGERLSDEDMINAQQFPDLTREQLQEYSSPPPARTTGTAQPSEPVQTEPEPVQTEPEPVQTEPEPVQTEPEPVQTGAADPDEEPPPALTAEDLANAETLEDLSAKEIQQFVPNRGRLPQNPNAQVDFTAYTLEWGEVRLGLQQVAIGILPLTQVGTSVPWWLMGIPNGQIKVTAVPWDPVALSLGAHVYSYNRETYDALQYGANAKLSIRLAQPWTLHLGYTWQHIDSEGDFDVTDLPPIWFGIGDDGSFQVMSQWEDDTIPVLEDFYLNGDMMTADLATDVRFNRRDSLIFQLRYIFWGKADSPAQDYLPDILYFDELLKSDGFIPFEYTYSVALSYQLAWRNVEVRAGVGWSGIPGAFLFQAFDAAYRFGGPTRLKEARMKQTWRKNKREARKRKNQEETE